MSVTMQSYAYESPVDATAAYQQIKAAARAEIRLPNSIVFMFALP